MKKRRHHFVWQHYLVPWTVDGQIACLREGKTFRTSTINIGVETDFYKLKALTEDDIRGIRLLVVDRSAPDLQPLHEGWLEMFTEVFRLRDLYEARGRHDAQLDAALAEAISNVEEDLHSRIESSAHDILAEMRDGNHGFFEEQEGFATFINFLSVQYMRTKKMKRSMVEAVRHFPLPGFSIERAWNVMSHMFATNIGAAHMRRRPDFRMAVLEAPRGAEFLTGDQPAINTFAEAMPSGQGPDKLEWFYPVTPRTAVLVGDSAHGALSGRRLLSRLEVQNYNQMIAEAAHEQVFSTSEEVLRGI